MEFEYSRIEDCILLDNLRNEVVKKSLAYIVDFKEHDNLIVIPKSYSIEISNADICIAVILYYGFEREEYKILKTKKNFHIVTFDRPIQTMVGYENMPIKHFDYMTLFFMSLSRTDYRTINDFLHLKALCRNNTTFHLRKKYILKDIVWNQDLFSLLYKKYKAKGDRKKSKNKFATSMDIDSHSSAFCEDNLKGIGSSFIKEFIDNRNFFAKKELLSELGQSMPMLVGFAMVSGKNRAIKAIELALSSILFKNEVFENTKTILLLISCHTVEINMDEIGTINDYLKEKTVYQADIVMYVNENENLGEALAVTVILSDSEKPEIN